MKEPWLHPAYTKAIYVETKTNGTTLAKVNMRRKFDNFGQAKEYISTVNDYSSNAFISGSQLIPTYDSNGRMIQIQKTQQNLVNGSIVTTTDYYNHYSYPLGSNNNMKQFTQTLTLNGTPVKQTDATHAADDRLLTLSGDTTRSYTYNLDGQMSTMTNSTGTTTYGYDAFGNLKSVTLPNTTAITYKVDSLNRRVKKLVNGSVTEYYLWYDQTHIAAILNASKAVKLAYFYGPGSNSPSYIYKAGFLYRIAQDPALGSIRYIIDPETSQILQEIEYDENGNFTLNTNPSFQPITFAGGLYDTDTKLIRFGARDYDPSIGRWTTKDPIGFNGGDTNLYAYVNGDPMSFIDPAGTDANRVQDGIHTYVEIGQTGQPIVRIDLSPAQSSTFNLITNQQVEGLVEINKIPGSSFTRNSSTILLTPQQDADIINKAKGIRQSFFQGKRKYQALPINGSNCSSFADELLGGK